LPPPRVFLIYQAFDGFAYMLMGTIVSVYLIVEANLQPFRLVILGTILEATVLIFEVPTGVLADTVSRKLSVVIGALVTGLGFIVLGLAPSFATAVFSQLMWGIGYTFISGADIAWITDEVGEERARPLYLRGSQVWLGASLAGIVAAASLATVSLGLPIFLSGVTSLAMAVFLGLFMREENFHPAPSGERKRPRLRDTVKSALSLRRRHPVLLLILSVAVFQGMSTEAFDRLAHFHFLRGIGLPSLGGLDTVLWFGILEGGGLLLGIIAVEIVRRKVDIDSHVSAAKALAVIDVLLIVAMVAFGATDHFWVGLGLFWVIALLREANDPVFTAWINQGLDPSTRATVNSMWGQADAFGQVLGGPVIGFIAQARAVGTAIIVAGVCRAPALGLFARAIRRGTVGTQSPDEMTKVEVQPGHIDIAGVDQPKD
jgi:DHA3 family tetracycline resistance protein-like MFS transporter